MRSFYIVSQSGFILNNVCYSHHFRAVVSCPMYCFAGQLRAQRANEHAPRLLRVASCLEVLRYVLFCRAINNIHRRTRCGVRRIQLPGTV